MNHETSLYEIVSRIMIDHDIVNYTIEPLNKDNYSFVIEYKPKYRIPDFKEDYGTCKVGARCNSLFEVNAFAEKLEKKIEERSRR